MMLNYLYPDSFLSNSNCCCFCCYLGKSHGFSKFDNKSFDVDGDEKEEVKIHVAQLDASITEPDPPAGGGLPASGTDPEGVIKIGSDEAVAGAGYEPSVTSPGLFPVSRFPGSHFSTPPPRGPPTPHNYPSMAHIQQLQQGQRGAQNTVTLDPGPGGQPGQPQSQCGTPSVASLQMV